MEAHLKITPAAWARETRKAQGLPATITDGVAVARALRSADKIETTALPQAA